MVVTMGQYLPIGVLGDPLQGIFDFGPGVVDWTTVEAAFAPKSLVSTPHRWSARNPNLGSWLLAIRPSLVAGGIIDLGAAGVPLIWRQSTADLSGERGYCISAATTAGNTKQVVALRQLPAQCHKFARTLIGKYDVAEEIECKVVGTLAKAIDIGDGGKIAAATIKLVRDCCIGCPSPFNPTLMASYSQGNAKRYNSGNQYAAIYDALNLLISQPTAANVRQALTILKAASQRVFRWEAWRVAMQLLEELSYAGGSATKQLQEVRNRTRYGTNTSNRNSISRTLLVKGQEYDECIILGADGMSARNLYVALSRGIDKVTVFSSQPVITIANY
jgi:DNA helicase-2/ATP-dependent DNA helicase PcrA